MDVLSMALSAEGNMVINRRLAELFDCKDTAFVLQYLIARQNKAGHGFTCNAKELEHGCIIGEHKRRSIFKRLKKENFLEIERRGAPAKNYFSVKIKNLETRFLVSEDQESKTLQAPSTIDGGIGSNEKTKNLATRNQESVYISLNNIIHKKQFSGKSSFCNEKKKDNEFFEKNSSHALKEKSQLDPKENPSKSIQKGGNLISEPEIQPDISKKQKRPKKELLKAKIKPIASEVISYLNAMANKNYRSESPETLKVIGKKVNEGFGIKEFKKVIEIKSSEWKNSIEMNRYLRPATLFGPKFESYLNSAPIKQEDPLKKAFLDQI